MCPCGSIISSFIDPIYVTGETILRFAFTLSARSMESFQMGDRTDGNLKYHKLVQKLSLKSELFGTVN